MGKTPSALINITTRHQVYLEGHKTHVAKAFDPFLRRMAGVVDRRLSGKDLSSFTGQRLERLIKNIDDDLSDVYKKHYGIWREQVIDLADYEAGFELRSLKQAYNVDYVLPGRRQLAASVFSKPFTGIQDPGIKGTLLAPFYRDWSQKNIRAVDGIIRGGFYQGLTTPQIVRQIKGLSAAGFRDGQLARGKKGMLMLTRTALQHASGVAREDVWQSNSDIVKGVRIVATLDNRTTDICRSLDGVEFAIGEGPRPPFHVGCRTTTAAALDGRLSALDRGATRFSRDEKGNAVVGEVPAKQTYYGWLKDQSAGYQDSVIGPSRGKLLRDGGMSSERFAELGLTKEFQPRTLKEMRKLEPLAFERAGL